MALKTKQEYISSLKRSNKKIYCFGEQITDYVDHPMIRPSINALAMTYELSHDPQYQDLMTRISSITGEKINRFTHLFQNCDDLVGYHLKSIYTEYPHNSSKFTIVILNS